MGAQLSLKAALPLAGILATASDRCNKTGSMCIILGAIVYIVEVQVQ